MEKYKDYQPTGFDPKGLFLDDQQDWYVLYGRNRDSGILTESNWQTIVNEMTDISEEEENWDIHRFNHWACGWFEIIIVEKWAKSKRSGACYITQNFELAEEIEDQLDNYPVLDEMDLSEREYEDMLESWDLWACSDFKSAILDKFEDEILEFESKTENYLYERHGFQDLESEMDLFDKDDYFELFRDLDGYWETHSDGPYFDLEYTVEKMNLDDLFNFLFSDFVNPLTFVDPNQITLEV